MSRETTLDETATVAWSYWEAISNGEIDEAVALISDDAVWWSSVTGERPIESMVEFLRIVADIVPIVFTLKGAYGTGDTVALEMSGHGPFDDGTSYDNEYCIVMTIRDGRITSIREHANSAYAIAVLVPKLPQAAFSALMGA